MFGDGLLADAFTTTYVDGTDSLPHRVGEMKRDALGRKYRFCQLHDPNGISGFGAGDAVGYVPGDEQEVTPDLSESDAGLFAGIWVGTTDPGDDGYGFVQVEGPYATASFEPTSDTTINAGDGLVWDQDRVLDRQTSADNDLAGKALETKTGMSTTTEIDLEIYVQGTIT